MKKSPFDEYADRFGRCFELYPSFHISRDAQAALVRKALDRGTPATNEEWRALERESLDGLPPLSLA